MCRSFRRIERQLGRFQASNRNFTSEIRIIVAISDRQTESTCQFTGNKFARIDPEQVECLGLQRRRLGDHRKRVLRGVRQRHLVQRERAQIRQQRLEAVHGQPLGRLLAGGLGLGARRDLRFLHRRLP